MVSGGDGKQVVGPGTQPGDGVGFSVTGDGDISNLPQSSFDTSFKDGQRATIPQQRGLQRDNMEEINYLGRK